MNGLSDSRRVFICLSGLSAVFFIFVCFLFKTQVVDAAEYRETKAALSSATVSIPAARGEITDRNGNPIVVNEQSYSLIFDASSFPSKAAERNGLIISLITLCEGNSIEWNDELPIEFDGAGALRFRDGRDNDIKALKSKDMLNLNDYATPQNCFDALAERYDIKGFNPVQTLKIASVRYSMEKSYFRISNPYTFAENVSAKIVSLVKENSSFFKGVEVQVVPRREYVDGTLAPHIIGRVAAINAEEYAEKKEEGYKITDEIGKSGIEYALEDYLRGTPGEKAVYTDSDGNRTSEITVPPQQGNTVVLTIDSGLQRVTQQALEDAILYQAGKKGNKVENAGAAVVLNCKTGEILACCSYPTYDISKYAENAAELNKDPAAPLWNRALLSTYATGSTMKPSVAIAALEEGVIDLDTRVLCTGMYDYLGQKFKCEQAHASAYVDVIHAIYESCNSFFYETGKNLGIEKMNEYRLLLGFGQKTGCELTEAAGILDSPEYRQSLGQDWLPGYTVQSAIGQAGNLFTPIQLANYCATIANGGTRYYTHFVKSIKSYDYRSTIVEKKPEVACETGISKETLDIVRGAMLKVCTIGYGRKDCAGLPVQAAAKTGTSQEYRTINGKYTKINNGFLIAFAPYEDPEIAIAIAGEGMVSGSFGFPAAADIIDYYFTETDDSTLPQQANHLLG